MEEELFIHVSFNILHACHAVHKYSIARKTIVCWSGCYVSQPNWLLGFNSVCKLKTNCYWFTKKGPVFESSYKIRHRKISLNLWQHYVKDSMTSRAGVLGCMISCFSMCAARELQTRKVLLTCSNTHSFDLWVCTIILIQNESKTVPNDLSRN